MGRTAPLLRQVFYDIRVRVVKTLLCGRGQGAYGGYTTRALHRVCSGLPICGTIQRHVMCLTDPRVISFNAAMDRSHACYVACNPVGLHCPIPVVTCIRGSGDDALPHAALKALEHGRAITITSLM